MSSKTANVLKVVLPAIVGLAGVFGTDIQGFISAHPAVSSVLGSLMAIIGVFVPSPAAKK